MSYFLKLFVICSGALSVSLAEALSESQLILLRQSDAFSTVGGGKIDKIGKAQGSHSCTMGMRKKSGGRFIVNLSLRENYEGGHTGAPLSDSTIFDSRNCTLSKRKDKNDKVFEYKTCISRRETLSSRLFRYDAPKVIVETLSFRPINANSSGWPIVDYEYKVQYEDPNAEAPRVTYRHNCNMLFAPSPALAEIMNM